jgi:hypothetical protein
MLTELCEHIDRIEDLDWKKAERLVDDLSPLEPQ